MINKAIFLALFFALAVHTMHLPQNHEAGVNLADGQVIIVADNGQYLHTCDGCGGTKQVSASISPKKDAGALWSLEIVGNKVAFKGSNKLYLSRCSGCWKGGSYPDAAVFVYSATPVATALWTPELLTNGRYAFKGDNGKYLSRCNHCSSNKTSASFVFAHEPNAANPWSQWNVVYANLPAPGVVTLRADNGGFLKICQTCIAKNAASVEKGNGPNFQWKLVRVGSKVAFQGANGQWLSRCTNCWTMTKGSYGFSAFANQPNNEADISQWTPVDLGGGKWAFKSDAGLYLARCHKCAATSVDELAFIHIPSWDSRYPEAHWTLSYIK